MSMAFDLRQAETVRAREGAMASHWNGMGRGHLVWGDEAQLRRVSNRESRTVDK
jgi:hypothetical protein